MWEPLQIFTVKSQDRNTQLGPWLCSLLRRSEPGLYSVRRPRGRLSADLGPFVDAGETEGDRARAPLWIAGPAGVDSQRPSEPNALGLSVCLQVPKPQAVCRCWW